MSKQLHSIGGVVYYVAQDGQPRYLIIKRHARSKKIERVAPKGKMEPGETPEQTCIREIKEEAGINPSSLKVYQKLGGLYIKNINFGHGYHEKQVTYYLVLFEGNPQDVLIQPVEGFIGVYKRATIQEIMGLILYPSMRSIFRTAHESIINTNSGNTLSIS